MLQNNTLFVCAGEIESIKGAIPVGIGLVNSAINLTKILSDLDAKNLSRSDRKIKQVVFVGSAGSYDRSVDILDVFISHKATQIEQSFILKNSYCPLDPMIWDDVVKSNQNRSDFLDLLTKSINSKIAVVNSSNFISQNNAFAQAMIERKILLENMEFYGVYMAAKSFGIEAFGVFCVTNYCDAKAHESFLKHHKNACEILETIFSGPF